MTKENRFLASHSERIGIMPRFILALAFAAFISIAAIGCSAQSAEIQVDSEENIRNAAVDEAMMRSGYAQVQSSILLDQPESNVTFYLFEDGTVGYSAAEGDLYLTKGIQPDETSIGSVKGLVWEAGQTVSYLYSPMDDALTIVFGKA